MRHCPEPLDGSRFGPPMTAGASPAGTEPGAEVAHANGLANHPASAA
jgi:hypothetical protein